MQAPSQMQRLLSVKRLGLDSDTVAYVLLTLIWGAAVILGDPRGDFPIIDDWAYRESVYYLVENGKLHFSNWTAANLFSHTLWGAVFSLLFNLSFDTLRLSTILLGWLGGICTYRIAREADGNSITAFVAAIPLLFNPVYFL